MTIWQSFIFMCIVYSRHTNQFVVRLCEAAAITSHYPYSTISWLSFSLNDLGVCIYNFSDIHSQIVHCHYVNLASWSDSLLE